MSDGTAPNFGHALRELRRRTGMSQRELAERTRLDFSYISKLENSRLPAPSADSVVAISRALAVPPEDLLALTGKIPSDVQHAVSTNREAQRFLLEAQQMRLTDLEWERMAASLRQLRGDP
jgi:transcriptional regulator with XRE-family HTH domain